jgi:hypothetical protein
MENLKGIFVFKISYHNHKYYNRLHIEPIKLTMTSQRDICHFQQAPATHSFLYHTNQPTRAHNKQII